MTEARLYVSDLDRLAQLVWDGDIPGFDKYVRGLYLRLMPSRQANAQWTRDWRKARADERSLVDPVFAEKSRKLREGRMLHATMTPEEWKEHKRKLGRESSKRNGPRNAMRRNARRRELRAQRKQMAEAAK